MRVALLNPRWSFEGSIYFGCREPHLPLELGAAKVLLEAAGHTALIIDGHLFDLDHGQILDRLEDFKPEMTVITTAPTYLFWRCAPPELRVPQELRAAIGDAGGILAVVGPHGSTTPRSTLRKLKADLVVMGECEEALVELALGRREDVFGLCYKDADGRVRVQGGPRMTVFKDLPPTAWPDGWVHRHHHHHHRFDHLPADGPAEPEGVALEGCGAELESSRGCPYRCSFCAKENFRDPYRRRDLKNVLAEIDRLQGQGVAYLYFADEIFLPNRPLLEALSGRGLKFGVQTRIDLWKPPMLELLGRAGCVSIEAGVESLTEEGRAALDKDCRLDTASLAALLIEAKRHVPFVQANLIKSADDDAEAIARWRKEVQRHGVWANDPVPLFPYPGSPDYRKRWGLPDDAAWERALDHYLAAHGDFSDLQEARPLPLSALERAA